MPVSRSVSGSQKRNTDAPVGDHELVHGARSRDPGAIRAIMKANNQRLYRLARGIVGSAGEAEDVVQEAYVHAFSSLDGFRGDSALSTWLSRIVINEALGSLRKKRRERAMIEASGPATEARILQFPSNMTETPERTMAQRQILHLVEQATDGLPPDFRCVFMARIIEGLSVEETADLLGIRPETVKTRLHRARQLIRKEIDAQIGPMLIDAFPFAGKRCDRLIEAVIQRLDHQSV
jgi:RNA polymerase sigma-70 factor (ECF subfamily)